MNKALKYAEETFDRICGVFTILDVVVMKQEDFKLHIQLAFIEGQQAGIEETSAIFKGTQK